MPAVLVLVILAMFAGPAAAAPTQVWPSLAQGGPVLSGSDGTVSWVAGRGQGPLRVMTAPAGGRDPMAVAELPPPASVITPSVVSRIVVMDGDPDGRISVSLLHEEYEKGRYSTQRAASRILYAGPSRGPVGRVGGCVAGEASCTAAYCAFHGHGALGPGGTLDFERSCAGSSPPRLVRRDAAGRELYGLTASRYLHPSLATAGSYVALVQSSDAYEGAQCFPSQVVVRDAASADLEYAAPPVNQRCQGPIDITAEGLIASITSSVSAYSASLEWRSLADRERRTVVIGDGVARFSPVAASGSRILVETQRRGGTALTVVGLDGSRTLVARFNKAWKRIAGIDIEGERVAWAERRCGTPRVVVTTADRPRRDPPARCG